MIFRSCNIPKEGRDGLPAGLISSSVRQRRMEGKRKRRKKKKRKEWRKKKRKKGR